VAVDRSVDAGRAVEPQPRGSLEVVRRGRAYRETLVRLCGQRAGEALDARWPGARDALVMWHVVASYPREVVVLDVCATFGPFSFHVAGHPRVRRVIAVDADLSVAEVLRDCVGPGAVDGAPPDLRVPDVTRRVLEEFPEERAKIQLEAGTQIGEAVAAASRAGAEGARLVVFVEGATGKAEVRERLAAIFDASGEVVVLLDRCRDRHGPFVQAGVVSALESARTPYEFRLLADLSPALASTALGVVYPASLADEVGEGLDRLARQFSTQFDVLHLLGREAELVEAACRLNEELTATRESLAEAQRTLEAARRDAEGARGQLETVYRSMSWRLTRPFRGIARLVAGGSPSGS